MAFTGSYSVTIDHTKCGSTNSTNFTVLIYGTYSYLRTVGNGGQATSSSGYDINFFSDSGLTTKLNWEVANYNPTTGSIEAYVKVGTLSHTADTVFYMGVGDSGITTFQGGATGTAWDSNYKAVYHLGDGTTLSLSDSTGTTSGTNHGATAVAGKLGGAASFNGSTSYIDMGVNTAVNAQANNVTLEAWIFDTNVDANAHGVISFAGTGPYLRVNNGKIDAVKSQVSDLGSGASTVASSGWTHIAFTYDGSGNLVIYYNGSPDGTASPGTSFATGTGNAGVIGSDNPLTGGSSSPTELFPGSIDEVRISTIARSGDWMLSNYNNQNSPSTFYTIASLSGGAAIANKIIEVNASLRRAAFW